MSIEENPTVSMARAGKIIRISIYTFLQHYHYFTSMAAFIALPFSISVLISQALVPRSFTLLPTIYGRFHMIAEAAGVPHSSEFFTLVTLKLSQTISSSILTLPFAISFLLLAKASIIHFFNKSKSSLLGLYQPLLSTHVCNSFVIFGANATCLSLFFLAFNFLEGFQPNSSYWVFFLSAVATVFYSIVIANSIVICNLASVSSAMERHKATGFMAILKACVTIRGNTTTALALAVPINIGLAAVEALFHYRIIRPNQHSLESETALWLVTLEGVLIAYIYSIILVLDVIMSCLFYQSCMSESRTSHEIDEEIMEIEDEQVYYYYDASKLKGLEEFV